MADENQNDEGPSFWDKTMNYIRGKAQAADKPPKQKTITTIDPDKAKEIQDSFNSVK